MRNEYIKTFFNKDPEMITLADIQNYFNLRQEEGATLEFKSGDVEMTDIYKEVSAFLNTEGGLLIVGSPRESKEINGKRITKYCQGEVTFSKFISKDWLSQKIFSNITPSPTNIFIKEIVTEQGNIFILDIPQSLYPPHQSNSDGRYYIRIDNEAKPAPHGLVQALFDKRKKPKLVSTIKRIGENLNTDRLYVSIKNDSNIPADKVSFLIDLYDVQVSRNELRFREINNDALGRKFSFSGKSDQVLVSVISFGTEFSILHQRKKYLLTVGYWCKDCDFDCTIFVVDPINNIVEEKNWLDEGANLISLLDELKT